MSDRHPVADAGDVRAEDAFDVEAVRAWLATQGREVSGPVEVRQFEGGASNLTFSLRTDTDDLILRRPPGGHKARGAHDMGREFRLQSGLREPFGLVPAMVAHCEDESVIGAPFYVMERVDGVIPRRDFPPEVRLAEDDVRRLCTGALDVLVRLHQVDAEAAGLAGLGKGEGYVRRQVGGWTARWQGAVTDDLTPERVAQADAVTAWLDAEQPDDVGSCVIHNDFRFDNLVLDRDDPTRVLAVLDWELATLGDPLMDLGCTLAYWVTDEDDDLFRRFRRQPTHLPGMLSRPEVVAYYAEATGLSVTPERWRFYEVYGLFRLAVISQQIYYRFHLGQTHNEAYAVFGPAADFLVQRCAGLIG